MIIVEGPDGAGKSTLIERLGYERRSCKALRGGVGEDDRGNWGGMDPAPIAYARQILQAECEGGRVAFDRFHLSETVYGPILRHASGINADEVRILNRLLQARGVTTILCLPPFQETVRNIQRPGRDRPAYQTLGFLRRSYRAWEHVRDSDRYDIFYNYVTQPDGLPRPTKQTCPLGVIGSPTARYLFVTAELNLTLNLPLFSIQGRAGLLNRTLWESGIREEDMAFVNARLSNGQLRDLRACLPASTAYIITVDAHADWIVRGQFHRPDLDIVTMPLPEYLRVHATQNSI